MPKTGFVLTLQLYLDSAHRNRRLRAYSPLFIHLPRTCRIYLDRNPYSVPPFQVGDTPLRVACERGGLRCVVALISARQFQTLNVDLRGNGGFTPLMAACANNRTSCVRALLDAPIAPNLDLTDYQNRTALDLAPTDLIRNMLRVQYTYLNLAFFCWGL
jgi:ankyrin repeat protein